MGSETVTSPERNPLDFATVATQTDSPAVSRFACQERERRERWKGYKMGGSVSLSTGRARGQCASSPAGQQLPRNFHQWTGQSLSLTLSVVESRPQTTPPYPAHKPCPPLEGKGLLGGYQFACAMEKFPVAFPVRNNPGIWGTIVSVVRPCSRVM